METFSTSADEAEKLLSTYDWMGRRIRKQFYTWNSGTLSYQLSTDTIFLYDGWNLICEFDASSSQPGTIIRSYIWGTDLSGSMQGAGGVGGLLKVTDYVGSTTHHFVAYDGNGKVAALIDGGTGAITARYESGPFAEPIRTVGAMAKKIPFRFSTKYTDNESGLIYYGYRYYNPSTGRWNSRDPLVEQGFVESKDGADIGVQPDLNLYGVLANTVVNSVDNLGGGHGILCACSFSPPKFPCFLGYHGHNRRVGPAVVPGPDTTPGKQKCTLNNQGKTITTRTTAACMQGIFTPTLICNCSSYSCDVKKTFTCLTNTKGKPRWAFTSYKIVKQCP
jgi:RHS repeat-associated protein